MPRHKKHDRPVEKVVSIPQSIVEEVDASLLDPLTGKPAFGQWSALVQALLTGWLDRRFSLPHIRPKDVNLEDLCEDSTSTEA